MRRTTLGIGSALVGVFALVVPTGTSGMPAADDVSIQVFLQQGNLMTRTNGLAFDIVTEVESASGVVQRVTIQISLPSGLRWGADGPDPSEGCTGTTPAVCVSETSANPVGTVGTGYRWNVVADQPGNYEITASVTPTEADPDVSNNTDTFGFEVVAGPGGGGGGGGATVAAGAARLAPKPVKAGAVVTASVRTTSSGAPVRPSGVRCTGTIGSAKVRGVPRARRGTASCTYRTPVAAKGKTLRGTISLTVGDTRFVRRFATRLS
jgi:hypothetical protein